MCWCTGGNDRCGNEMLNGLDRQDAQVYVCHIVMLACLGTTEQVGTMVEARVRLKDALIGYA
jgi:hypothetical protein